MRKGSYYFIFLLIGVTFPVALAIMMTQLHSRKLLFKCVIPVSSNHIQANS